MFDVRSPAEYSRGHIPGALSLPLFDDAERAQVGTCFKHNGRFAAIQLGLTLVGPKLGDMLQRVQALAGVQPGDGVLVYCWRGGMRSSSVCWMLGLCGFRAAALNGGYRAFRRWVQSLLHSAPASAMSSGGEDDADGENRSCGGEGGTCAGRAAAASAVAEIASAAASAPASSSSSAAAAVAAAAATATPASAVESGQIFARAKAAKEGGRLSEAIELFRRALGAGHPRVDQCVSRGLNPLTLLLIINLACCFASHAHLADPEVPDGS